MRYPETIYVATKNPHKVEEFRALLAVMNASVRGLPEDVPDCLEHGATFESNAVEKAVHYAQYCDGWVLADDSGLCVDALDGAPGVLSARFAGRHGDSEANNQKLLDELRGVPDEGRTARFVCALALWNRRDGRGWVVRGEVEGRIAQAPSGGNGFGYDPLFYIPQLGCTAAELSPERKNDISHRARAVERLLALWG